jgi:hypothetical protein
MSNRVPTRIVTATTTLIQTGQCRLYGIVINQAVANGVVAVRNGTTALSPLVAQITSPATLLHNQISLDYQGMELSSGLTIVTTGTQDITVIHGPI